MRIRPASTMFAALHGELELHPWRDPRGAPSDAYSLFVARSSAMGLLTEAVDHTSGGLWGMNDAGQNPHSRSQPSRIAWFQVSLTNSVLTGRPLPVQAFLSCADDVVARIGTMRLQAVQVLLPVQSFGLPRVNAAMVLLQDAGWFADCDPQVKTQVRVTVGSGQDPTIRSAAPGMLRWMQELKQGVFLCDPLSLTDDDDVTVLDPTVIDELWLGPAHHQVTFRGTLIEWSLDALGWLAAFLAEASSQHGVSTPLMFTASRTEELFPKVLHL